jgi:hypothetical protein
MGLGGAILGGIAFLVGIGIHVAFGYRGAMQYERNRAIATPAHFTAREEQAVHRHG